MYEIAANYLMPALAAIGTGVGLLLAWLIWDRIGDGKIKRVLMRIEEALGAAISEAAAAWAASIREAGADGVITDAEKEAAKAAAVRTVRDYLGPKGVRAALKVLGLDESMLDHWIGNKAIAGAVAHGLIPGVAAMADPEPGK